PLDAPGGEARSLTQARNGAHSPAWSPDGTQLAYLAPMRAEERAKEDDPKQEDEVPADKLAAKHAKDRRDQDEKAWFDPVRVWRIPYREGTRYVDERYAQIYSIGTGENSEAKPRRLTNLDADYSPPLWGAAGDYLYTSRASQPDMDEPRFRSSAVYRIHVEDGREERITGDDVIAMGVRPAPQGDWLAFMQRPRDSVVAEPFDLCVMPGDGGPATVLTREHDRSIGEFVWDADGKSLVCTVAAQAVVTARRISREGGSFEMLAAGQIHITSLSVAPDGAVAFAASTPEQPSDVYVQTENAPEDFQKLTDINADFLQEVIVQAPQLMPYEGEDGQALQGWYILPVDYQAGQQYPLALNIHGGPAAMWSIAERSMWHEWQLHAARGYVVLATNPRGSDGYGRDFRMANQGNWGPLPMSDVLHGVDTLLEKGFVDESRMAVTGGSYGGYLTAWIIGHSDRFAAAVAQRGVYNLLNFYGTSDVPILISDTFGVEPWEDHVLLWEHSPVAYAHQITTPLLIIHAENDFRVPIAEAEHLFALVRRATDTPVELWRYPRDGHEMSRSGEPQHRVSRLEKMVAWFDQYCRVPG
ncbi:MAG: prolyl oligopeptidase family serine peptidase, partial [Anaerolineales bacterium]